MKRRDAVLERLALCVMFAAVLASALLQACSGADYVAETGATVSFSVEPGDVPAPENVSAGEVGDSASLAGGEAEEPEPEIPRVGIDALVEPHGANVAVSLASLDGSASLDVNGDESFVSASMIKLLVLACLMDEVGDGVLSLEQTYELNAVDIVGGTAHINALPLGTVLSYDELAESMIAYSDNTATNVLIDVLGMDAINETAKTYGLANTSLQRKMMDFGGTAENYMSANDAIKLLVGFANGDIGSSALSERAIDYLKAQTDNTALAQGIPEGVSFAHKTGSLNDFRHDGGIVYADEPYALVVFTSAGAAADGLMASISSAAYAALSADEASEKGV